MASKQEAQKTQCRVCGKTFPRSILPKVCNECAPALLGRMIDDANGNDPIPQNLTDLGNMERLVVRHGQDFRYSKAGGWMRWDGNRWATDHLGKINEAAYDTARKIRAEANLVRGRDEESIKIKETIIKWSKQSESKSRLDAMVNLAQSDEKIATRLEDFDQNLSLFNCANGTIDLTSGDLKSADRADLLTNMSPVVDDAGAVCPRWKQFVLEVMSGDQEMADFLQRAVGYSLTGETSEQCMFILWGTGANGKTTFIELVRHVLGTYAQAADFQTFMAKRFGPQSGPSSDIAKLRGARFVSATEGEDGQKLAESIIKQITGGDTITACFKFKEHFEFRPQLTLWLSTNHKPQVVGTDEGIWRRIRLIDFNEHFSKDDTLATTLKSEAPGILRWAIEGLKQWQKFGLMEPQRVLRTTTDYRADEDIIVRFINDECEIAKGSETPSRKLYDAYKAWAKDNHEIEMSERKFADSMKDHGYVKRKKPAGMFYTGLSRLGQTVPMGDFEEAMHG
jgi:putative DNA primase/helicase